MERKQRRPDCGLYHSCNKGYNYQVIPRGSWNRLERFLQCLPSIDLQFHGTFEDVQSILGVMSKYKIPSKKGTLKLGLHLDEGVWVMPDKTLDTNGSS